MRKGEDQHILSCKAVSEGPSPVLAGRRDCQRCGTEVWVSMAMLPVVDAGQVDAHCGPCADFVADSSDDVTWGIHPDQMDSMIRHDNLGWALRVVKRKNRRAHG